MPDYKTPTILLIEDDMDVVELVRHSLVQLPLAPQVHHVAGGNEALDYLRRRGGYADAQFNACPVLILLDLRLPAMDGFEILRALKQDNDLRKIPVVVITGSNSQSDIAKAYEYQANSYLVKPRNYAKFSEVIRESVFYWLKWNQLPQCLI